jgi:hypothetical protein
MDAGHKIIIPDKLQTTINNITKTFPNPRNASIVKNYSNLLVGVKWRKDLERHHGRCRNERVWYIENAVVVGKPLAKE